MIVYYNGSYLQKEQVCISPDDRGFLFGDGTYEVIRVYNSRIYRLEDHLKRLKRSLNEIQINNVDVSQLEEAANSLLIKNPEISQDAVLYIQITRGVAPRNHRFPEDIKSTIYMALSATSVDPKVQKQGVKIILQPDERWGRCDIKSIALLANVLAAEEARHQNAYETVFVRNGMITEGTRTNIAAVFNGKVYTHPTSHHILGGITRDVVLELCNTLNIPVFEESISKDNLFQADEIFLMGTSTEIGPVIKVENSDINNGQPGPVTRKIQEAFRYEIKMESI